VERSGERREREDVLEKAGEMMPRRDLKNRKERLEEVLRGEPDIQDKALRERFGCSQTMVENARKRLDLRKCDRGAILSRDDRVRLRSGTRRENRAAMKRRIGAFYAGARAEKKEDEETDYMALIRSGFEKGEGP
jgi:hypothetical protein